MSKKFIIAFLVSLSITGSLFAGTPFTCTANEFNLGEVQVALSGTIENSYTIKNLILSLDKRLAFKAPLVKLSLHGKPEFPGNLLRFKVPHEFLNLFVVDTYVALLVPKSIGSTQDFVAYLTLNPTAGHRSDSIQCHLR